MAQIVVIVQILKPRLDARRWATSVPSGSVPAVIFEAGTRLP
jgi:hypothetical protein